MCPQLREPQARVGGEGRLCRAPEHRHPVLLQTPPSFRFSSAGTIPLVSHGDRTRRRAAPAEGSANRPALGRGMRCSRAAGSGRATGDDAAARFPSPAARHVEPRDARGSAGAQCNSSARLNALLGDCRTDLNPPHQTEPSLSAPRKRQRAGRPPAPGGGGAHNPLTNASACSIPLSASSAQFFLHMPNLA